MTDEELEGRGGRARGSARDVDPGARETWGDPPAPVLLIMPDSDARLDLARPLLGVAPAERLARAARVAGFAKVVLAPGTGSVSGADERATGEPIARPALVVYEGATVHPDLLRLMVQHPLDPDERFTLYDAVGRPTGLFTGALSSVPASMPISEELDWPDELGPESVARLVYAEDQPRVEQLVLRGEQVFDPGQSLWRRHLSLRLIRSLTNSGAPIAQLELLGLVLAVGAGGLALLGGWGTLVLAAASLLLGVEVSRLIPAVRALRGDAPGLARAAHTLVPDAVVRPFGHAALTAALTFVLVSETGRSGVAGLVLLGVGAAAVLLSLVQARTLLRRQGLVSLELPDSAELVERLGVRFPERYEVPLVIESSVLALALTGVTGLPWGVLVAAGIARLWRWFASPVGLPSGDDDGGAARS